jgi:8-oxo-dGTP pyrophosphatase MutT (NUDIX family)
MLHPTDLTARLRAGLDPEPDVVAPAGDRLAGVLALLVGAPDPDLILTVRAGSLSRHAGEVSFPGGLLEPGETPAEAALRETHEELGLDPCLPEILGALRPVHTHVSGILVVPFVGTLSALPALRVSEGEISAVLSAPVRRLASTEAPMRLERGDGTVWHGWRYDVEGHTVWGATGGMVHELLELIRKEAPWVTA